MSDQYADVQQSFGRCLRENPTFVDQFYQRLLDSDEDIRAMFTHTDWTQQNKLIRRGISLAITYAGSPIAAKRQMAEIAQVHSRKGRAPVKPEYYDHWVNSLMTTVADSGPRHNEKLEQRWRTALKPALHLIIDQY